MIYLVSTVHFRGFMSTGKRTPSTDEVCDALNAIKERYPHLEATEVITSGMLEMPHAGIVWTQNLELPRHGVLGWMLPLVATLLYPRHTLCFSLLRCWRTRTCSLSLSCGLIVGRAWLALLATVRASRCCAGAGFPGCRWRSC